MTKMPKFIDPAARLKKRRELPVFDPAPDPLQSVRYTGDVQRDTESEMSALSVGFQQRMRREQQRVNDELDSENWINIVFETRAQKGAFLRLAGLAECGDKYLDGRDVAAALGVDLPPSGRVFRPAPKISQEYAELAVPLKKT